MGYSTYICLRLAVSALGFAIVGCAVSPEVTYHDLKKNAADRTDSWVTFQLTDTAIALATTAKVPTQINPGGVAASTKDEISLAEATVRCPSDCDKVVAFAAPVPFDEVIYAMNPVSPFYKTTKIPPTYIGDTLRLKSLSVETQDHRKEIIETAGSIAINLAKAAVGVAAAVPAAVELPTLYLPTVINLAEVKAAKGKEEDLPRNEKWKYQLTFLDDPEAAGYLKRETLNAPSRRRGAAVSSTCRPAKLTLKNEHIPDTPLLEFGLSIADPDFIATTPLPVKGTVSFHDLCGADVKIEQENTTSTKDLVDTLFKQVNDLRKAFQKPKSAS